MIELYPFDSIDKKQWEYHRVYQTILDNIVIDSKKILALGAGNDPVSYWLYEHWLDRQQIDILHTDISDHCLKLFSDRILIPNNVKCGIESRNVDMITFDGIKNNEIFDCIYHVSSIEHFSLNKIAESLANSVKKLSKNGILVFTGDTLYLYPEEIGVCRHPKDTDESYNIKVQTQDDNYLHFKKIKFIIDKCLDLGLELLEDFDINNENLLFEYAVKNMHLINKKETILPRHTKSKSSKNPYGHLLLPPVLFCFRRSQNEIYS